MIKRFSYKIKFKLTDIYLIISKDFLTKFKQCLEVAMMLKYLNFFLLFVCECFNIKKNTYKYCVIVGPVLSFVNVTLCFGILFFVFLLCIHLFCFSHVGLAVICTSNGTQDYVYSISLLCTMRVSHCRVVSSKFHT